MSDPPTRAWREGASHLLFKLLPTPFEKLSRFLIVLVAAPELGVAAFGRYQFALTASLLVMTFTELGLGTWTTRAVARDITRASSIVLSGLRVRVLTALPFALLIGIVAFVQAPGESRRAIALLGVATLAGSFVDYASAVLRGLEDFRREAVVSLLRALVTTGAALLALALAPTVTALSTGLAVSAVASALFGLGQMRTGASVESASAPRAVEESPRARLRDLAPLWLAGLFSVLYFRCDIALLHVLASDADVGYYGSAYRIFETVMWLPSAMMAVAFPRLARRGAHERLWGVTTSQLLALLAVMGAAAALILVLGSERLVRVAFGPAFQPAAASLRVLALTSPFLFLNFGLTSFMFAEGRERQYLVLVAAMFVLNVALNALFIPRWGGPGAALATLVTEAALAGGCGLAHGRRVTERA